MMKEIVRLDDGRWLAQWRNHFGDLIDELGPFTAREDALEAQQQNGAKWESWLATGA